MSKKVLGIDFGTRQLKIYRKEEGVVLSQKTVIAIEKDRLEFIGLPYKENKRVKAVGDVAFEMLEKAPITITVSYPLHNGVIADMENMKLLLEHFLDAVLKNGRAKKGFEYLVAVPNDISEVEKRAFFDIIASITGKNKNIYMVEKPIAVALGLGIDLMETQGSMIVDIGADTTEISIVSFGGIVNSKLIRAGGSSFDAAVKSLVRKKHRLYIGDRTAENLKIALCDALEEEEMTQVVFGRDVVRGLPVQAEVSSELVFEAMSSQLKTISDTIQLLFERTPPEISAMIKRNGIYITGGSSKIKNLSTLISKETNLKVNLRNERETPVCLGLGRIMEEEKLGKLKYVPKHVH